MKELVCDTCNQPITNGESEGAVEWLHEDDGGIRDLRVVHKTSAPPRQGCWEYERTARSGWWGLDQLVGRNGFWAALGIYARASGTGRSAAMLMLRLLDAGFFGAGEHRAPADMYGIEAPDTPERGPGRTDRGRG